MHRKVLLILTLVGLLVACEPKHTGGNDAGHDGTTAAHSPAPASRSESPTAAESRRILADYVGSASCTECHAEAARVWTGSHHALAERPIDPEQQRVAFDPPRAIKHGTQTSRAYEKDGKFVLETLGPFGKIEPFTVERVFGVHPLYQFLVAASRGRYQATELAFDPVKQEWFDVYGDEDRTSGEWGHWTGRGMSWNSMCAGCHNTRLLKGYDRKSDTYDTRMAERGVGCEACHGPLRGHVEWQRAAKRGETPAVPEDPTLLRLSQTQVLPMCGSCHSRRTELTGAFVPGERYLDHFSPVITDETEIYYPDGQVLEEDFEFVSFLSSRMRGEGVLCINCHEPHSGKVRFQGNDLCLQCHKGKIDPATHSQHAPGTPGGNCVDCHMPLTTYMQRHPRRDHGFTIPDPELTRDYGVPNACNRCHTDKSTEWAIAAVETRHGERMNRITRKRARAVAAARRREDGALERLLVMSREEKHPFWRAVLGGLLKLWPEDERARTVLARLTRDPDPLVRGTAAKALEFSVPLGDTNVERSLTRLLRDPVRMVRVHAAWALRRSIDPGSTAGSDLWRMLQYSSDQPGGAYQIAAYTLDRGSPRGAIPYFERAIEWDSHSAPIREGFAVALSMIGRLHEAVHQMEEACRLAPDDAVNAFKLGLAQSELGRLSDAIASFSRAVKLSPDFGRAWYNLGLARVKLGNPSGGLEALRKAEEVEPRSPEYPYARATVLGEMGRIAEAKEAAYEALRLDPDYRPAQNLLDVLPPD